MALALDIASWAALVAGGALYLIGAVGLIRMPDVFTRMHAVSVSDTLGVMLLILGMSLQSGLTLVTVKLVVILAILMITGPVASHALARAALHDGNRPLLAGDDGVLVATDCHDISLELGARLTSPLISEVVEEAAPVADEPASDEGEGEGAASKT